MADAQVVLVESSDLRAALRAIFNGFAVPMDAATKVSQLLVEADLRGVDSHGVNLMTLYGTRLRNGQLRPNAELRVLRDDGATVHLDAGLGFGQLAGLRGAELALERAREHGVAMIGIREATHLGALAAYTERVAIGGCICFCFQNGPTFVPPFGGVTPLLSTNPLSYAIPTADEPTIVYDVATTTVAGNKLILAKKRGDQRIPDGWANDEQGRPTTNPADASVRHLQWFGAHKGFGLALLVELLAGVLCDSSFGRTEHTASDLHGEARVAKGVLLLALDPRRFMELPEFRRRVDTLIRDIRGSERAEGVERIWLPGEQEHLRRLERERDGVPLPVALVEELRSLATEVGAKSL